VDSQTILKGLPGTYKVDNVNLTKKGGVLTLIVCKEGAEALKIRDWTIASAALA